MVQDRAQSLARRANGRSQAERCLMRALATIRENPGAMRLAAGATGVVDHGIHIIEFVRLAQAC